MRHSFTILCLFWLSALVSAQPKYIFYLIGDGMGSNQVLLTEMYLAELEGRIGRQELIMTRLPIAGMVTTFSTSNSITDSSAAGTALATGTKTQNGTLGISSTGDTLTTIAEQLHDAGWGVALLTTVAIDHATPAAFYANNSSRNDYYNIGTQLIQSGFNFFGGAGFHNPDSDGQTNLYDLARQAGYTFAGGTKQADELLLNTDKMIVLQESDLLDKHAEGSNFPYAIDRRHGDMDLKDLTTTAIRFMEHLDKPFFMMIEGGMIDYACHGRDAAATIYETLDFDAAIGVVLNFYNAHPDETLIIVTSDHETGGLGLGNSHYTLNLQILQHQHCSSWVLSDMLSELYKEGCKPSWAEVKSLLTEQLDLYRQIEVSKEEDAELRAIYKQTRSKKQASVNTLYKDINKLANAATALINKKAMVGWTSYSHTGAAVPIFAIGQGAEHFTGWMDNTDIAPRILNLTLSPAAGR